MILSDKVTRSFYGFDNIFSQFLSKSRNVHFKRNRIKIEFRFTKPPGSLQNFQFCFWKAFVARQKFENQIFLGSEDDIFSILRERMFFWIQNTIREPNFCFDSRSFSSIQSQNSHFEFPHIKWLCQIIIRAQFKNFCLIFNRRITCKCDNWHIFFRRAHFF